jgi:energy-coupling factor transporter transmembrane protein EcfT
MLLIETITYRHKEDISFTLKFSLPFLLPLLFIHGFLNPSFLKNIHFLYHINISAEGLKYGFTIFSRILMLTVSIAVWRNLHFEEAIDDLLSLSFPPAILMTFLICASTLKQISHKITSVYIAQQARGIKVGPGIFKRISSFPKVLIPIIVSTLVDCYSCGELMTNRGMGMFPIVRGDKSKQIFLKVNLPLLAPISLLGVAIWLHF